MESSSYAERQEDEVQFLQCVFMGDFEDLRNHDPWKVRLLYLSLALINMLL